MGATLSDTNCWEVDFHGMRYKRLKNGEWMRWSAILHTYFTVPEQWKINALNLLVEEAEKQRLMGKHPAR